MGSLGGGGGIFISYRREETAAQAGRLYDHLSNHFGEDRVFMDIDSIAMGTDFTKAVIEAVSGCNIILALIGPHWSAITDTKGIRRIDYPQDWVRVEIETALQRNIRVVPVLVDEAVLPHVADLPPSLRPLIRHQALELSYTGFRSQVSRLIAAIDDVFEVGSGQPAEVNAIDRLLQRAGETHWAFRPSKQFLEPVAAVLSSQERVLGTCTLAFTRFINCCFTVTNRNLCFSTDKNNGHWMGLCEQTPARFRINERVLKIPLTAVDACAIKNNVFTLQIRDEPAITFNHLPGKPAHNANTWVEKFMGMGRTAEAARTPSRATAVREEWTAEVVERTGKLVVIEIQLSHTTYHLRVEGSVFRMMHPSLKTPVKRKAIGVQFILQDGPNQVQADCVSQTVLGALWTGASGRAGHGTLKLNGRQACIW
jgi:hypothetical protein